MTVTTALRFLPPVAWSALIAWFSGAGFSADSTAPLLEPWLRALLPWAAPEQIAALHWLLRKAGHVAEYAVLALLWSRAIAGPTGRTPWRRPLLLAALTAGLDEAHQATTHVREGSLADALMPKMDGREMCRRIKEDPETAGIKVVVMTSVYVHPKYRTEGVRVYQADEYLTKPLDLSQLSAFLQKHLG